METTLIRHENTSLWMEHLNMTLDTNPYSIIRGINNFSSRAADPLDVLKIIVCHESVFNNVLTYGEICAGYILDNLKVSLENKYPEHLICILACDFRNLNHLKNLAVRLHTTIN
jgi:hypothetical protein